MSAFTKERWERAEELTDIGIVSLLAMIQCPQSRAFLEYLQHQRFIYRNNCLTKKEVQNSGDVVVAMRIGTHEEAYQLTGRTKSFAVL